MKTTAILPERPLRERRSVERLLAPLEAAAENSPRFISKSSGRFDGEGRAYSLPRFIYVGAKGGGDTIRIGVLATLHGDEPEGALALIRFAEVLESNPEIAKGYALFLYPVCNPTGFEDNTFRSRNGADLDREFWRDSTEAEIRYLESEIWMHAFDGIITLRSDGGSDGLRGHAAGSILSLHLLEPALREAERFVPGGTGRIQLRNDSAAPKSPSGLSRPPFEVNLETPRSAPLHRQVEAVSVALQTILLEYRYLIAIAQDI